MELFGALPGTYRPPFKKISSFWKFFVLKFKHIKRGLKYVDFDTKKIKAYCKKYKIKLLVLHGSLAKGTATKESDIDIGILSEDKIEGDQYFEILKDFGEVFGDKFDPVFLNGAEPLISYQVAMGGKPLFEKIKGAFANFQLQAIARYIDTKKLRDMEKDYIKRAVGKK
jgi:predicted nucleotidyltransferase